MYQYDRERTGRVPHQAEYNALPQLVWETRFKQWPVCCAESTAVEDEAGNLYFGNHDGCFYSLSPNGSVRWQWVTDSKIYASPLLYNNRLYVNVSRAHLACLDTDGNLQWIIDGTDGMKSLSRISRFIQHRKAYHHYDYEFKKFMKLNAWASPNQLQDGRIASVLYHKGLVVVDPDAGKEAWSYNPGGHIFHMAGVAITTVNGEDRLFFASQSNGLHVLNQSGQLLWKTASRKRHNAWANPSVDVQEGVVYYSESYKNRSCVLYKYSLDGTLHWKKEFPFGCRSTAGITYLSHIVLLGLDGKAYYISKADGQVLHALSIATTDRGLWTSPAILKNGNVLVNTKKTVKSGSLICLSPTMEVLWEIPYGKALSTPFINAQGALFTGTWNGDYFKYQENPNT